MFAKLFSVVRNVTATPNNQNMNRENIQRYIQTTIQMPTEKAKILADKFELFELPKNELLLTENKLSKKLFNTRKNCFE